MDLRSTIDELAKTFAEGVLSAIREASVAEVLASKASDASRSLRRFPAADVGSPVSSTETTSPRTKSVAARTARPSGDPKAHAGEVLAELMKHPEGLRSEQLQKALQLTKAQLVPVLGWALSEGRITKTGERRGTTYKAK
jgi:hypothetical protein